MAKISVIIPAYNASATILETIGSVQSQTFADFELIVVDDGSTDNTLAILKSIGDERLKIISSQNGGVAAARNLGISQANGEFFTFLDADDLWTVDKLQLQLEALLDNPEASVAYSFTQYIDEYSQPLWKGPRIPIEDNVYRDLLVSNFLHSGSNPLIRKTAVDAIGGFDRAYAPCEDWDFYLRLAAKYSFVVVPKYQILYRQLSNSMSAKVDVMRDGGLFTIDTSFQAAPSEYQHLKGKSLAIFYKYCARLYLRNTGDMAGLNSAGVSAFQVLKLYPWALIDLDSTRLLVLIALKSLLPNDWANYLIQEYRKSPFAAKNALRRKQEKELSQLSQLPKNTKKALV